MTQYNIDPTKPQEFHQTMEFSDFDRPESIEYSFDRLKKQVGLELYSILEQMTSPVVVELIEKTPDVRLAPEKFNMDFYLHQQKIRAEIIVKLRPVQYKDVVFYRNPALSVQTFLKDYTPKPEKFMDKLKYLFGKSK